MMPIVDALMHLPAGSNCDTSVKASLDDYLAQHTEFHVLRALAVQPIQNSTESVTHAKLIQQLATTRGSGGLPHGLMVHIPVDESAYDQLKECMKQQCHRGIAVQIDDKLVAQNDTNNSMLLQCCSELETTNAVINM